MSQDKVFEKVWAVVIARSVSVGIAAQWYLCNAEKNRGETQLISLLITGNICVSSCCVTPVGTQAKMS